MNMKLSILVTIALAVSFYGCHLPAAKSPTETKAADQLVEAIQIKDQVRALELIESGHPIEGKADQKNEPAYWAIATNNKDALEALIKHGLELDTDWGIDGGNLLTNAVQFGHMTIVRVLVEAGAPVIRDPTKGRSPLYSSIIYGHKEIEDFLRSKGAKLNDWDMDAFDRLGLNEE